MPWCINSRARHLLKQNAFGDELLETEQTSQQRDYLLRWRNGNCVFSSTHGNLRECKRIPSLFRNLPSDRYEQKTNEKKQTASSQASRVSLIALARTNADRFDFNTTAPFPRLLTPTEAFESRNWCYFATYTWVGIERKGAKSNRCLSVVLGTPCHIREKVRSSDRPVKNNTRLPSGVIPLFFEWHPPLHPRVVAEYIMT